MQAAHSLVVLGQALIFNWIILHIHQSLKPNIRAVLCPFPDDKLHKSDAGIQLKERPCTKKKSEQATSSCPVHFY